VDGELNILIDHNSREVKAGQDCAAIFAAACLGGRICRRGARG